MFIGCGVAAAIAAGFHAPIAGVVFAHEAVLRHFSFRALTLLLFRVSHQSGFPRLFLAVIRLFALDANGN